MQRFITDERTGIQYELIGDYYYPCLTIENEEPSTLIKYGRTREKYLREHKKVLYFNLLTSGKLYEHLAEIDTSACNMAEYLIKEMARKQGVTEQLKAEDMLSIAALLSKGEALPFTDEEVEPMTIIYQTTEDDADDTVVPRFNSAGGNGENLIFIKEDEKSLSFGDNRIAEAIEKYHAKLLILDPMSSYIGENCSMNNANETRAEFNHLIAVAKNTGCAIVIIAHMNKMRDTNPLYRTNGSIDIAGAARSILAITHTPNKEAPAERYMLLITNDGRKLALDQRLVNPMLPSDPNSKAAKCAENVFEIWRRTADKRSTQMIFCDLSTPKDDGAFSVYDDIHAKLLELGIPENEIAFIHNAKSEVQKKDLFGKVRSGQVRILLGSTQRMGAGTNCQQKLIALHHLDCPWRPSDLQQREGRIIRQGNENPEVDIYSYVTEGTFDAYLYQLVESKQKFISQIMTSKSPVRSAEDVDEQALSYAEIKALASGNPMIKEKMDLDIEVSKLKLLKANHLSQKYALEDAISKGFPKQIAETQARIAGYGADIATVKENTHPNADGFSPLTLAGVTHADKKEAGAALLTMCQTMISPEATQIGSYRGLTLELSFDTFAREYRLTMIGQLRHTVTLGTDVFGNLQRMDNALEGLPIKEQTCREQLSNLQTQLETAKAEVQKPFPREEELTTKTARLEELNSLLNLDHKEPEIVDAEPDEDQRPPERRRPQLER